MPTFKYQARNANKELVQGTMVAENEQEVVSNLRKLSFLPLKIEVNSKNQNTSKDDGITLNLFQKKIEPVDVLLFSQQMSTLLRSGVPILRALGGIQESAPNPTFGKVIKTIRDDLDAGKPLSACLAKHPNAFDNYYVNMIRVGEMSGKLEDVFLKLHEQLEFSRLMSNQIKTATRYPMFVILTMIGAIAIINFFVIPAFAKIYAGFKAELPIFTKILITSSELTTTYWWVVLASIAIASFLIKNWLKTKTGRKAWDKWKLSIPIAGKIIHKAIMARFSKSLSLSLNAGVPIASALALVSETSDNAFMVERLGTLKTQIEHGSSLHKAAVESAVFTPIALQMILVGEESGALEDMLQDVSELYQSQVEYELKTLGSQIEPILILFLGVMVLILALGVFLPIWDLGSVAIKKV